MQHQVKFGSRKIMFYLEYRKRKSFTIKVHPDGKVEVLAPLAASEEQVFGKVKLKAPWILKQIDQFNSYKPSTPARRFINGETHLYLGRQYRLKVVPDKTSAVKAHRGQLWMHSATMDTHSLKIQLDDWYKERANIIFTDLLNEVFPAFRRYKLTMPLLIIRKMSKRWGSCTASGKIILNTELVKASKGCIEYVIVHELCHLVHYNHASAFQNLLNKMLPEWNKWKERLEYSLV